jgi:hypothetical protein
MSLHSCGELLPVWNLRAPVREKVLAAVHHLARHTAKGLVDAACEHRPEGQVKGEHVNLKKG